MASADWGNTMKGASQRAEALVSVAGLWMSDNPEDHTRYRSALDAIYVSLALLSSYQSMSPIRTCTDLVARIDEITKYG
ncbi:hypothetical protein ACFXO9_31700 [Nocardia tengchongensis]|uniref:hypothetical protein n=1 Tax=Nocardia tengchongensis TaxID=2055889 RepID=UPI0036776CE1